MFDEIDIRRHLLLNINLMHALTVQAKVEAILVGLFTQQTDVRFLPSMCAAMALQVRRLVKATSAELALVGSFTGVNPIVDTHRSLEPEPLVAARAREGFLTSMDDRVRYKERTTREQLLADGTLDEVFLVCAPSVCLQRGLR